MWSRLLYSAVILDLKQKHKLKYSKRVLRTLIIALLRNIFRELLSSENGTRRTNIGRLFTIITLGVGIFLHLTPPYFGSIVDKSNILLLPWYHCNIKKKLISKKHVLQLKHKYTLAYIMFKKKITIFWHEEF